MSLVPALSVLEASSTLKVGYIHGENFADRDVMRTAVFNYIECDDNRWGPHSACGGLSPEPFENQTLA